MTFNELKSEVSALGFENRLYKDSRLAAFAKRAQSTIFSDRAVTKTVKIFVPNFKPQSKLSGIAHKGGTSESFSISGVSVSLELCGIGTVKILNRDGSSYQKQFNGDNVVIKRFINGGGATVTLSGEFPFYLTSLMSFGGAVGQDTADIPESNGRVINKQIKEMGDFLCFTGAPCDKNGMVCECICMEDGEITFPISIHGEFYVTYRRAPMPINPDKPLSAIDIPKQCEHLLTLLTASYMSLEFDEEQAALYKDDYKRQMKELNQSSSNRIIGLYHDVTGWA